VNTIIGEKVKVVASSDPTQIGFRGSVVLETFGTFLLRLESKTVRLQKKGVVLQLAGTKDLVRGDEMEGRLQDRIGRATRR
jgi:RNase P/RNase MRP subunit p29